MTAIVHVHKHTHDITVWHKYIYTYHTHITVNSPTFWYPYSTNVKGGIVLSCEVAQT